MIDNIDLVLILSLIESPLASDQELKQILNKKSKSIDISISSINRRVNQLITNNIVQGAVPELNYSALELQLHTFILVLDSNAWEHNASILKKFFDEHPYTNFQCRIYGANNGIFCQFILPINSKALDLLKECFQIFIDQKIITSYKHYPKSGESISTPSRLTRWDMNYEQWKIDFTGIDQELSTNTEKYYPKSNSVGSIVSELQPLDLIILRELTRNSRRSQSEILRYIKKEDPEGLYRDYFGDLNNPSSKQTFSRRYNFLLECGLISHFELAYDRYQFGIFNQALYIGKNNPIKLGGLKNSIQKEFIPFSCRLSFSHENFIFWVNLPPVEIIHFPDRLLNHFENLKVYMFGRFPAKYFFYHKNLDFNTHTWKTNKDWIFTNPLKSINLI